MPGVGSDSERYRRASPRNDRASRLRIRTLHALVPRTGQLEAQHRLQPVPVEPDGLFVQPRLPISRAET